MVWNKSIKIINETLVDQINKTGNILTNEKGCTELDANYTNYTISFAPSSLPKEELQQLSAELLYYYDFKNVLKIPQTQPDSKPLIRCTLHNGETLEANSYYFRNVNSRKSLRNIHIQSNGTIFSKRESTIIDKRQKYLKYTNTEGFCNIYTKEFAIEAIGEQEHVKIEYIPNHSITKTYRNITHKIIEIGTEKKETIHISGKYCNHQIEDFTLRLNNGIFTSGTLVLKDLTPDKSRVVIKVNDGHVTIYSYSSKGKKTNLLDDNKYFILILRILEPDTSKVDCPYLKRLINAFTYGVSTSIINKNVDPNYFNLVAIQELDKKVSEEVKQIKGEMLVPELISVMDEYFAKEKRTDNVLSLC